MSEMGGTFGKTGEEWKCGGWTLFMSSNLTVLILEALSVYLCVLWAHSLRKYAGFAPFYALLGGITAIMSWVTDAGVSVEVAGITFMVGSTVFYTSLLLGVFVVYVFDGPRATRIAILTVAGVSIMAPLMALALHLQMKISGHAPLCYVPVPSFRINAASVLATVTDLVFLAVAWEYFGKPSLKIQLWLRSFLTLLGVMWLDVLLFATGAFLKNPEYFSIMKGTFLSRLIIAIFASPFLYLYLHWNNRRMGIAIENRPVLTILKELSEVQVELSLAQQEIEYRKKVEKEKEGLIGELQKALLEVKTLRGFLPICARCKKIRNDEGYWQQIEGYIQEHSEAVFSHGICPDCADLLYPEFTKRGSKSRS
jgi:uncharacterized PurR-regulated membrane protein YhhQ (DUF165 family)